jgi:hypothetical protein
MKEGLLKLERTRFVCSYTKKTISFAERMDPEPCNKWILLTGKYDLWATDRFIPRFGRFAERRHRDLKQGTK